MSSKKLGYHLEQVATEGTEAVVCSECQEQLCEAGENYKLHALSQIFPMEEAGPLLNDPDVYVDDEMEFRQYYCPGCATLLENEVILSQLDPIHDRELK